MHVTVLVPKAKTAPEVGAHTTLAPFVQLSTAAGLLKVTAVWFVVAGIQYENVRQTRQNRRRCVDECNDLRSADAVSTNVSASPHPREYSRTTACGTLHK